MISEIRDDSILDCSELLSFKSSENHGTILGFDKGKPNPNDTALENVTMTTWEIRGKESCEKRVYKLSEMPVFLGDSNKWEGSIGSLPFKTKENLKI